MKIPWKRIAQAVLLLLALGFLAAMLVSQWQALLAYEWQLRPGWAFVALLGLGLAWLVQVGLWRAILVRLGGVLPYGQALRIWFLSNIIRYIPGNVWQFLGMAELAAEQGVSRVATLTSVILQQAISIASGLVLAALYFAVAGEAAWLVRLRPFLYALPAGLLLLQPRLLERALNRLLARLKRQPIQVTLTWGQVWALLLGYAIAWCLMGAGFAALVRALTALSWSQVPAMVAIFAASYVIGFLSLLTPSGLGVREGVMTVLLTPLLSAGVAAVVAVVGRLWMVVGELIGVGLSLLAPTRRGSASRVANRDRPTGSSRADLSGHLPVSTIRRRIPLAILLLLILAYTVGFSALSIRLHDAQLTHKSDLGQMDLAIWNTSRGRFVQEVKMDTVSTRLTDHVEPIFAPVSLVFWLWDDVRALLILQSLALAIGALPVFLLARSSGRSLGAGPQGASWLGLLAALVYLMVPALQAANLTEFHAIPLAVPLILFAFWFAERANWIGFAVASLLLLTVKEEAALLALMLGLYVALRPVVRGLPGRTRAGAVSEPSSVGGTLASATDPVSRDIGTAAGYPVIVGSVVAVVSAVWFVVATFVIIPAHASSAYGDATSVYFQRYGELGNSVTDILRNLLTRPGLVWRTVAEPLRLRYLAGLLAPLGFLPLLAPEILLLGAPLLAANLLSSYAAQYSGGFHYSAPLVPYLVIGAVIGARRLARWSATRRRTSRISGPSQTGAWACLMIWVLAWGLGWQVAQGYTPIGSKYRWPAVTDHHRLLARFTAQVPSRAPGSVTSALYPHLSHREKLYLFPHLGDAQWVLLDVTGATDMHPVALRDQVLDMIDSGEWGVKDGADGYLLLAQGQQERHIPDSFYDFARHEVPRPQTPASLAFTAPGSPSQPGPLRFLGHDIVDDEQWRLTTVRTYWQAADRLSPDTHIRPFLVAKDGTLIEDTTERTPVGPLWYPPQSWAPGETVVVETLPWFLPNHWGLAVGVSQVQSWGQREERWQVSAPPPMKTYDHSTWALLAVYERRAGSLVEVEEQGYKQPEVAIATNFADQLQLLGHSSLPESVVAGSSIDLEMLWQAQQPLASDFSLFVHLRDEHDRTVGQWDGQPTWYGEQPTAGWPPDQPTRSAHTLDLAEDLAPGNHRLVAGVYDWRSAKRLPILDQNGQIAGEELDLGVIEVETPSSQAATTDLCCALVPECCISEE